MNFKISGILLSAASVMSLSVLASSCRPDGGKAVASGDAAFVTDSISYVDSASVGKSSVYCSIKLDYPVEGNETLVKNVRKWIGVQLACSPMIRTETPVSQPYDTITDGNMLVKTVGDKVVGDSKADLADFGDEFTAGYEFYWNIFEAYQTDRYVTYLSDSYAYMGGAHGGSSVAGAVFAKADGRLYGWDMFKPGSEAELTAIVKEGLMKDYFNVSTEQEFRDCLLVDADTLPLPSAAPYFTGDGVEFTYQQYEIAPYSLGMPSVTVPFATVAPLMTPAAAALIE